MFLSRSVGSWTTVRIATSIAFFAQLQFYVPLITPFLQARGLDLAQIALLQSVVLWTQFVLEVPTGVIADRIGRRWSVTLALVAQLCGQTLFLLAHDYWTFVLAQVITGTGFAFASGSVDALVFESLPVVDRTARMQQAKGQIGTAVQAASLIAWVAGPIFAMDLSLTRIALAIALAIIATGIACVTSLALREPRVARGSATPHSLTLLRDGIGLFRRNPRLRRISLAYILTNAFIAHLLVFYQAYFVQTGVPGIWLGLALGFGSLLGLLGQRYAHLLVRGPAQHHGLVVATALPGILYLAMAVNRHPTLAVLLFCLQWGTIQISAPLFAGYLNEHIPDESRATALSLLNAMLSAYVGLVGLLVGIVATTSLPTSFALMGLLVLAGVVAFRLDERHLGEPTGSMHS